MSTYFDPDALLADARARSRASHALADQARARLGVETATRRPRTSSSSTEGLSAEEIERDTRTLKGVMAAWKRVRFRRKTGTSVISLPSGRRLVYDWDREEVVK